MAESIQTPNDMAPPIPPPPPPPVAVAAAEPPPTPAPAKQPGGFVSFLSKHKRPALSVTTEFDSESSLFLHKLSCKVFDRLAKLNLSFQNNRKGDVLDPRISLTSKPLSIHYDLKDNNAVFKTAFDVGPRLHFRGAHDVKAQQGEIAMTAKLSDPAYAVELSSPVPNIGLPRVTLKFPPGEVSLGTREEDEVERTVSIGGIVKGNILNGVCTVQYSDEDFKLRYRYKDEAVTFIPSIILPSDALSFAFKRRFNPCNKLSYLYHFDSNKWSAVYKHTHGKDLKLKAGYDSEERLGWASLWVGDEAGKMKAAPKKMKVQFKLQVPQDDIRSSALTFLVKKRWDIL